MANDALRYSLVQKLKDEHCLCAYIKAMATRHFNKLAG